MILGLTKDVLIGLILVGIGFAAAMVILFRLVFAFEKFSSARLKLWAEGKSNELSWEVLDDPPPLLGTMRDQCRAMSDTTVVKGQVFISSMDQKIAVYVPRQSFSGARNTNGRVIAFLALGEGDCMPDFLIERRELISSPLALTGFDSRLRVPNRYAVNKQWDILCDGADEAELVYTSIGTAALQSILEDDTLYEVAGAGQKLVLIGPYATKPESLGHMYLLAEHCRQEMYS